VKKTAGAGFGIKVKQYFSGKNILGAGRKQVLQIQKNQALTGVFSPEDITVKTPIHL
jgi:hypothetical protein